MKKDLRLKLLRHKKSYNSDQTKIKRMGKHSNIIVLYGTYDGITKHQSLSSA